MDVLLSIVPDTTPGTEVVAIFMVIRAKSSLPEMHYIPFPMTDNSLNR